MPCRLPGGAAPAAAAGRAHRAAAPGDRAAPPRPAGRARARAIRAAARARPREGRPRPLECGSGTVSSCSDAGFSSSDSKQPSCIATRRRALGSVSIRRAAASMARHIRWTVSRSHLSRSNDASISAGVAVYDRASVGRACPCSSTAIGSESGARCVGSTAECVASLGVCTVTSPPGSSRCVAGAAAAFRRARVCRPEAAAAGCGCAVEESNDSSIY